ncbi:helix-turn-helix transcriptional regulator [Microbacterium soli]|uniref:HTH cro/C1-type domain-containing protein n=1 Tax=Microbacterium soli TaxID=446075 RepID=A0ABP7NL16_9MICO
MSKHAIEQTPAYENPFHSGDRIRKAREHIGQDRQTFAATVGLHRDTLAKYEDGGKAKRSALISIAWATGTRLEWLEDGVLPWLATDAPGPEVPTPAV